MYIFTSAKVVVLAILFKIDESATSAIAWDLEGFPPIFFWIPIISPKASLNIKYKYKYGAGVEC